ncbi:MAG: VCBS domain-containing protein, partial [Desulfovibrionaceae bacterium]|nr:VCBS domain-containing protein [Desulfovibrionaceae bacterium]
MPVVPGEYDPDTPVTPTPDGSGDGDWDGAGLTTGTDVLRVWENTLADNDPETSTAHGAMQITALDGVATIVLEGVTIYDGTTVNTEASIATDEGHLCNFTYNVETGVLEYDYVLDRNTEEHSVQGADEIGHQFRLTVTDTDGDAGYGVITVLIVDDMPEAVADENAVREDSPTAAPVTASGNVMHDGSGQIEDEEGNILAAGDAEDSEGADGARLTGAKAEGDASESAVEEGGSVTLQGLYGTLVIGSDGSYEYTLDRTNRKVQALGDDSEPLTDVFEYTITDGDGDDSSTTLTIFIRGTTHGVELGAEEDVLTVDEAYLATEKSTGSRIEDDLNKDGEIQNTAKGSLTFSAPDG